MQIFEEWLNESHPSTWQGDGYYRYNGGLYKNKDDHGKNFAFLYDEELNSYKLSPAYDITSTPTKFEHEMTVNGNGNPTEEDLMLIAKHFKLSIQTCQNIIKELKNKL